MAIGFLNDSVKVTIEDRVAKIEMNQPYGLNLLNNDMVKDLVQILKEISISDEINIVLLTGKDEAFSANVNNHIKNNEMNESDFYYTMDLFNELIVTLYSMPKITLSALSGTASGIGLSLILATDHILVTKTSKLAMNFMDMGLIPDGGIHFFVERRLGEDRAKHLIWDGEMICVDEAIQLNLINEITEGHLQQAINEKIQKWLQSPIQAMIKSKKILAEKNRPYLLKMLELEKFAQYKMSQTIDHQECCKAAMEERQPNFIGKIERRKHFNYSFL